MAQNSPESEREAMAQRVASDPRLQSSMKVMGFAKQTIVEEHFQGKFLDKEFMEKIFNEHNEEVKNYVPAKKLLVYDVCEGRESHCEFLDIKVLVEPLSEIEAFSCLESLVNETKQPLLNRKEIASILNISLVTLTEWMKKGLPYHKPNRRVYFLKDEVIDYIKSQKNHSSGW